VYHFYREATEKDGKKEKEETQKFGQHVHLFGDPFFMRAGAEETLGSIKRRARQKLGVDEAEFKKWRWAFHSLGKTSEELPDDEIVANLFATRKDQYGAYENYLGAEHEDLNPRKTAAAKRNGNAAGGFDQRAVKIYG
jgi:hypothetical protein